MKIGMDLGGSHIAIGVVNDENKIIENYEKDFTKQEKDNIIETIEEYIKETVTNLKEKYNIEKIGIAVPGSIKNGIMMNCVNLGIEKYNIRSKITELCGIEPQVINDSKSACIAEYSNLNIQNANVLFLAIGTGIGGGVIYQGKLLKGNEYDGFEIGHMVIKENGLQCNCGKKGCFEKYGSIPELKKKVRQVLNLSNEVDRQDLRDQMDLNEEKVHEIKEQYTSDLALGISNLVNIFEPDIIILGGGYAHFDYMFGKQIKNKILNSNLLFNKREDIDIRVAKLGNDAAIIGSVL
jgi:glucokinase